MDMSSDVGIDVDMDTDSGMAASMNWGSIKGVRAPVRGTRLQGCYRLHSRNIYIYIWCSVDQPPPPPQWFRVLGL